MTEVRSDCDPELHHRSKDGKLCFHYTLYGLTCDEYDAMRARAGGHCEICGVPEELTKRKRLVVDHFHAGRASFIRGLLCDTCNTSVMPCIDGLKAWGVNRQWEAKAREYEANSWEQPSAAALALMAARVEKQPKYRRRPMPTRDRINAIAVPTRQGVPAMAERLLAYLTPDEIAELVVLLRPEVADDAC